MTSVSIVADDLTGTMDTAHGFATRGYETAVVAVPTDDLSARQEVPSSDVVGSNTDSRYAEPGAAADAVKRAVTAVSGELVYKKVDSTLRGNVGAEVDAALTATGAPLAVFAPAFPDAGRTTRDGVHYVDGVPVHETEYGDDERGPSSPAVAALFDGYRPVASVTAGTIDKGLNRVAAAFADAVKGSDRAPVVVCDARSSTDLSVIADAAAEHDALYAGSGGLAQHVTVPDAAADRTRGYTFGNGAPLGIVGSVNKTTLAQLDRVPDPSVIEVDTTVLLAGGPLTDAAMRAAETCDGGRAAVLTAATNTAAVDQTLDVAREQGLSPATVRERIADGLAATAARAYRKADPSGIFLTGGDVAVAGLRALETTTVELSGKAVEAGVPVGRLADGMAAGTPVVTKAGGFGSEATIVNCLELLAGNNE